MYYARIVKMKESNGNIQYFVELCGGGKHLGTNCFQTKFDMTEKECMQYAYFEASRIVQFLDQKMSDVKFFNLTEDDISYITKQNVISRKLV